MSRRSKVLGPKAWVIAHLGLSGRTNRSAVQENSRCLLLFVPLILLMAAIFLGGKERHTELMRRLDPGYDDSPFTAVT